MCESGEFIDGGTSQKVRVGSVFQMEKAARNFRFVLFLQLLTDILVLFIGSFANVGEYSLPDMILLLLGYYAEDKLRKEALKLYGILTCASCFVDCLVTVGVIHTVVYEFNRIFGTEFSHFLINWITGLIGFFFVIKLLCKAFSMLFAWMLYHQWIKVEHHFITQPN